MSFNNSFLDTTSSPPRRNRPSTASQLGRTSIENSLGSLPPLNTLPVIQLSTNNTSSPSFESPSTAQILSAAARSVDYFGKAWEDSSTVTKDFSQKRSNSTSRANLGPSPILGPGLVSDGGIVQSGTEEIARSRGHSRNRSQATKGSSATGSSTKSSKGTSQKAMLSKALQKANTAVLLDNAQNFDGAMQAYSEACALLQQVMQRSSGDEDKRKLEAIVSFVSDVNFCCG